MLDFMNSCLAKRNVNWKNEHFKLTLNWVHTKFGTLWYTNSCQVLYLHMVLGKDSGNLITLCQRPILYIFELMRKKLTPIHIFLPVFYTFLCIFIWTLIQTWHFPNYFNSKFILQFCFASWSGIMIEAEM